MQRQNLYYKTSIKVDFVVICFMRISFAFSYCDEEMNNLPQQTLAMWFSAKSKHNSKPREMLVDF